MMNTPRLLLISEIPRYVVFRRRMLEEAPWAFLSTAADDISSDPIQLEQKLSGPENVIQIVSTSDGEFLAAAGVVRQERAKVRHRAFVWGVYTVPAARNQGLGAAVVSAAVETARGWPTGEGVGVYPE